MNDDEWIDCFYGRCERTGDNSWWYERGGTSAAGGDLPPATKLAYGTRLMQQPEPVMSLLPADAIGDTVWILVACMIEDLPRLAYDRSLPLKDRIAFVENVGDFYERCFARLCPSHQEHGANTSRIEIACHMFWDLISLSPQQSERARSLRRQFGRRVGLETATDDVVDDEVKIDEALYRTIERILALPNWQCQAAALHGLGHWGPDPRVSEIIDGYLERSNVPHHLREYAKRCRTGNIQ